MSTTDMKKSLKIAVYSDDQSVRAAIITALGTRVAKDLPVHEIVEFATGPALRLYVDEKRQVDLFILDGEAVPEGGLGIARQLKDEVFNCPPVLAIAFKITGVPLGQKRMKWFFTRLILLLWPQK